MKNKGILTIEIDLDKWILKDNNGEYFTIIPNNNYKEKNININYDGIKVTINKCGNEFILHDGMALTPINGF